MATGGRRFRRKSPWLHSSRITIIGKR
jgi:hypothetical protein